MNDLSKNILSISILAILFPATIHAETQVLPTIEVQAEEQNPLKSQQIITNNQDLTRYSTDMAVPETGRFGSRGFNIRGAESNQVAITVDGIAQAESNNYKAFSRYSYYNNSRPVIDTELMGEVKINKSADSRVGDGALGGSVNYQTKTIDDILLDNRKLGATLKNTYNGQNREWINTIGGAFDSQYVDGLAIYSHRRGHETQINSDGPDIMGSGRGLPNPYTHYQYSYLAKLGLKFNDEHRLELKSLKQRSKNIGQELSYSTITLRDFYDVQQIENNGLTYIYHPKDTLLKELKFDLNQQDSEISSTNTQKSISTQRTTDDTLRLFKTKNKQATLDISSKPIHQHYLSGQIGYAQSDFSFDMQTYTAGINPTDKNMQQPVKQEKWFVSLGDNFQISPQWSVQMNARYEHQNYQSEQNDLAEKTYNLWAGNVRLNYAFTPNWQLGYKLSRGFRTPTASEMYFNREIAGPMGMNQSFLANPNLSPETSLSHEISLVGDGKLGRLQATAYHTDYKDMIDLVNLGSSTYQSQNVNHATVKGLDISSLLDLNHVWNKLPEGLNFTTGIGYAKGERDDGASLLSIQPLKVLFGLGYTAPQNDWSLQLQGTYLQGKKARDAQEYAITSNSGYLNYANSLTTYPYLNSSATVFDLMAHKKFGKQTEIQVGVYNLFNKRYFTWDSLRTIGSTNPSVANRISGDGINRYVAPERSFMASVEYKF